MTIASRRYAAEEGFSLIEVALAVGLFGMVMIAMSVMFRSAFSTTSQARAGQLAKTLAQEKLEEIRSLPYYEPLQVTESDVDVLDRYFPNLITSNQPTATGATGRYDPTASVWTYTSTSTATKPKAPTFTVKAALQFVTAQPDGGLAPVQPGASYNSNAANQDRPPSDTLKIVVTVSYTQLGKARTVTLDTLATRVKQQAPKVEASGSITALELAGVGFQDGDVGGVAAEIVARFGSASSQYREITESTSQASARPIEVEERRADTSANVQSPLPSGSASASVPNSTTGNSQTSNLTLPAGTMASTNAPSAVIASWCSDGGACQANAQSQVSTTHFLTPEGRATLTGRSLLVNARDSLQTAPNRVLQAGEVTGSVEQRSTSTESRVTTTMTLRDMKVWASTSFLANPRYEGTVLIDELTLNVQSRAGTTISQNVVDWQILGLRVWDPNKVNANLTIGGYGETYNFGFDNDCVVGGGQWTSIPPGQPGHSCQAPAENPNPVVIPTAYQGTSGGQTVTSLQIVAGATIQESTLDATTGVSSANTSQKSVITIITREDITGAAALEPSITTLGSASATVSYIEHEH